MEIQLVVYMVAQADEQVIVDLKPLRDFTFIRAGTFFFGRIVSQDVSQGCGPQILGFDEAVASVLMGTFPLEWSGK